ncbi:stalk domain-containing protein [Paenibacillus sp. JX-17]|uniref:Stalk domain-containing protein n=1 Tax=Paenibacillus lacisoli TaxID=3064525 RepID=A0ABT9CCM0_9BACL|nr:stalk domain-containing protein [Paenibacillus sp. JX-17]MDO7906625.1 stalk domain-containing protein [Paenibacillus sp. JX-17]
MNKWTIKLGSITLALLLWLTAVLPASADTSAMLELVIKAGSTTASINGSKVTIAKPYQVSGATMVPAGVFKKAFGSQIKLEKDTVVKIMNGPHTIALTISSKVAWVDGKKIKLSASPEMAKGVLMVPLRQVAEALGAKLSMNSAGQTVVRMKADDNPAGSDPGSIDSDQGKTQIGNSYYQWSMSYPTGMVVGESSADESYASFSDAESSYYLEVQVDDQDYELTADDLLEQLVQDAKDSGETVLDRQSIPQAAVPYARVITKDADGVFWENRLYYANHRLYTVYLADSKASNYKDLKEYAVLLNSFQPAFNKEDKSLKDISTVENGMRTAYDADYGMEMEVPADWNMGGANLFVNKKGTSFETRVTSSPAKSTLDDWSAQLQSWLKQTYVPASVEDKGFTSRDIADEQAHVHEFRYNSGSGWTTEYAVLLQKNGYRYMLEFKVSDKHSEDKPLFDKIIASLTIDYDVVSDNFGQLDEDTVLLDKTKTVKKKSKTNGFTIDIPRYWVPVNDKFESQEIEYGFTGGRFAMSVSPDSSFDLTVAQLKDFYEKSAKNFKNLKMDSISELTFAGEPAVSFTYHQVDNGIPYSGREIVFEHGGKTYVIHTELDDANQTPEQKAALEAALSSFTFTP